MAADDLFSDRPYQISGVWKVCDGLRAGGRGQLHSACGTGKTLMGLWAAQRLCPFGAVVVVACPTIGLLNQTLGVWKDNNAGHVALAVCSDETVQRDESARVSDISLAEVTTDPQEIAGWLRRNRRAPMRLVVVTHKSSAALGQALLAAGLSADLLIVDEAHNIAGREDKVAAVLLHDELFPAQRRLCMTATPRILAADADASARLKYLSMDDEALFGPTLFRYTFADAIADGYLDNYQVAVVGVTRAEALAVLRDHGAAELDGHGSTLHTAMVQAAVARAAADLGLRRVLVFCPSIAESKRFTQSFATTLGHLAPEAKPAGRLIAEHVDGRMRFAARQRSLHKLAHPDDGECVVISNVRCLSEGLDVPALDAVGFHSPRKSMIEVIQAVSRALRPNPDGSGIATIIVPVLRPDPDDEMADVAAGFTEAGYDTLWHVMRALRALDDVLAAELDTSRATGNPSKYLRERIRLDMPGTYPDNSVLAHLTVKIVQQTTVSWWDGYRHAAEFHAKHGHLRVKDGHVDECGYALGNWINRTRVHRHKLTAEQVDAADKIGMVWNAAEARWWDTFAVLARHHAEYGHLEPRHDWTVPEGWSPFPVPKPRAWLDRQPALRERGELNEAQVAALDRLGMRWAPEESSYDKYLRQAREFKAEFGHLRPPFTGKWHKLAIWLARMRRERAAGSLASQRVRDLTELGMDWTPEPADDARFNEGIAAATAYKDQYGNLNVPQGHPPVGKVVLQQWLPRQQHKFQAGLLTAPQAAAFRALGYELSAPEGNAKREKALAQARAVLAEFGSVDRIPSTHETEDGFKFHSWRLGQRTQFRRGLMSEEMAKTLRRMGIELDTRPQRQIGPVPKGHAKRKRGLARAVAVIKQFGDVESVPRGHVTADGFNFHSWYASQRHRYRQGLLTDEALKDLADHGIDVTTAGRPGRKKREAPPDTAQRPSTRTKARRS